MAVNMVGFDGSVNTAASVNPRREYLGKEDFLQLLLAQIKNQDPLAVMKDTEFIAQLAQFSTLEEMKNLSSSSASILQFSQLTQSASLIGHQVYIRDAQTGEVITGTVSAIRLEQGIPYLVVNNQLYPMEEVELVS